MVYMYKGKIVAQSRDEAEMRQPLEYIYKKEAEQAARIEVDPSMGEWFIAKVGKYWRIEIDGKYWYSHHGHLIEKGAEI